MNAKERVKAKWPDATSWRYIDCAGHHVEITDKPDYSEDDSEEEIILGNGDDLEAAWQDAASRLSPDPATREETNSEQNLDLSNV